jgi:hypothetical protein
MSRWVQTAQQAFLEWQRQQAVSAVAAEQIMVLAEEERKEESAPDPASTEMRAFIRTEQRKDPKLDKLISRLETLGPGECWEAKEKGGSHRYLLVGDEKLLARELLYSPHRGAEEISLWPLVIPRSMAPTVLAHFHGNKTVLGHLGIFKTLWHKEAIRVAGR